MKKFIVLLLVALMIVGLFVSCKNEPKKEDPSELTVVYVGGAIEAYFVQYFDAVEELVSLPEKTPAALAALEVEIETALEAEGWANAEATVTESSILAKASDADEINTQEFELSDIKYEEDVVSGFFAIKDSQRINGVSLKVDTKGSFEASLTGRTIECTSVIFNGIDYAVEKFNEFLNPEID